MTIYVWEKIPYKPHIAADVEVYQLPPIVERPAPRCPECNRTIGPLQYAPPFHVSLEFEDGVVEFGDILEFSADSVLVSANFMREWMKGRLKGLSEFQRVSVEEVRGKRPHGLATPVYHHARVKRSRAAIDDRASGLMRETDKPVCPECRIGGIVKRVARVVLEPEPKPEDDIFLARGLPGRTLVSDRFKSFCEQHGFKNTLFVEAERYTFDHYQGEN